MGEEGSVSAASYFIANAHDELLRVSYEKRRFTGKNSELIGGAFTALSPLNPPLLLPTALCWQAKNYNLGNFKRNFVTAQFASCFLKSNLYTVKMSRHDIH